MLFYTTIIVAEDGAVVFVDVVVIAVVDYQVLILFA